MPVSNKTAVLSVVIGSYNRLSLLHACIQSIRGSSITTRVYVTDAGSQDGTVEYLKSLNPKEVKCIFHPQKIGQAKAYNEIFNEITTPYTCWLSDDNIVVNDSLATAVSILEQDTRIGMVALKVRDMQGPFANEPYIGGISSSGILNVNQGLLRTNLLQGLGGFSEAFMDYGIDPDLTARILFSGNDIVYTRDTALHHWRDWGTDAQLERQLQKQKEYQTLYRKTFVQNQTKPKNRRLKRLYRNVGRLLKHAPGIQKSLRLKSLLRDINNIFSCHYISPYDPISCAGKVYYLRQSLQNQKRLKPSSVELETSEVLENAKKTDDPSHNKYFAEDSGVRIAINAQLLEGSAGGIETNLLQLLRALSLRNMPGDAQFLIGPGGESAWLNAHTSACQSIIAWQPIRYSHFSIQGWLIKIFRQIQSWKRSRLNNAHMSRTGIKGLEHELKSNGVELIHFPYQRFFPTSLPFIFEPWDLQHIYLPELFTKEEILFRNQHYKEASQKATVVVTATKSSKFDIVRHYQIPASKVAVIYRGIESQDIKPIEEKIAASGDGEQVSMYDEPYAIYPAKPWPHKNHERLFAALAKLRSESGLRIPLICTGRAVKGKEGFLEGLAEQYAIRDQIDCTGYLSEHEIQHYLANARLLLYPSLFEGLGIPLLEAMDQGVPIACSNVSCIPEVVGRSAIMFNPYSIDDIAAKILAVWSNDSLRMELAIRGKQRSKDFSWEHAASSFHLLYRFIARRPLSEHERIELQRLFC
ncbi:glycosyltransferase [Cyanobium sp. ATX 6F1]|uniref:glycosyltransferase n=1 Tax=unclassified Cyanobium TaxID=2627006 RepID=UPI0020CD4970|nr:glycosyltransferase [Cyanobium sp. ATX 6F1]MCP9916785.1 glycosyltransferase [Cyanobium sp. ATX 6F1]